MLLCLYSWWYGHFFFLFSWFASLVIMIRAPHFWPLYAPFLPSPHFFFTPLVLKIECYSCKSSSSLGCPVGTKRGLKMVENTSKMMLRASKIDQGMAKIITQKIERILKNFSFFRLLQTGLCNVGFLYRSQQTPHKRWGFITHLEGVSWLPLFVSWPSVLLLLARHNLSKLGFCSCCERHFFVLCWAVWKICRNVGFAERRLQLVSSWWWYSMWWWDNNNRIKLP